MINRRQFLTSSLRYGVTLLSLPISTNNLSALNTQPGVPPKYKLILDTPTRFFDGKSCWTHPRVGIIPDASQNGNAVAVMTMNKLDLAGSDVFTEMSGMHSLNLGRQWEGPYLIDSLNPVEETIEKVKRPVAISDFWPSYHAASGKLLGIGHTVVYTPEWKVLPIRPRHTAFSVYDVDKGSWNQWQKMEMPDPEKFSNAGAGCVQRFDQEDGTILLPFYFSPPGKNARVAVASCTFDGKNLQYRKHGTELSVSDNTRGLHEPSITRYKGIYFLTLRNDLQGYVTKSTDGLHFDPIRPWKFDDGTDLGNYNTQQHWVTHKDGLFLVYTRRGANNDHVFRHRAPLFMAEVDAEKLCVIRETEQILVPERGARLGNFGVTYVDPYETWVTVSEWMQPKGVEKHGSDGSVYIARIQWEHPSQ